VKIESSAIVNAKHLAAKRSDCGRVSTVSLVMGEATENLISTIPAHGFDVPSSNVKHWTRANAWLYESYDSSQALPKQD
jgi:hypothetical protein